MGILLYLISICDGLKIVLLSIGITLFVTFIIIYISCLFSDWWRYPELGIKLKPKIRNLSILFGIIILIGCFIPDTKTMYINFALTSFAKSDVYNKANTVTIKALSLLEKKLDGYLVETNK